VALIGDHDPDVTAHRAIPRAIELASAAVGAPVVAQWIPTDEIADTARLEAFDGLWCVPASPYRSMDGALRAIRFAREQRRPFLGTCGGFQHAVLEYARNVLGWSDAGHAETDPDAARVVVAPLECSLVEVSGDVHLLPDTHLARAYGAPSAREGYHCRYGMNPAFRDELAHGPLRIAATDELGDRCSRTPQTSLAQAVRSSTARARWSRRRGRIRSGPSSRPIRSSGATPLIPRTSGLMQLGSRPTETCARCLVI
jgi:CTP synthase (UTP-ammonia lyase)